MQKISFIPSRILKIILFFVVVGLFVLAFNVAPFKDFFYTLIFWTEELMNSQPLLGALVFLLLSAFSAILAFASTVPLVPSALLAWGAPLTFLLLLTGWLMGSVLAYWIGLRFARPNITIFITHEKLNHYEQFISQKTNFWIILLFCLAVPSEIPGYVLGTMRYSFRRFMIAMFIAEGIYGIGILLIAQNILDQSLASIVPLILIFAFLFGTASAMFLSLEKRKTRHR